MNNDPQKLETRVLHDRFGRFAASASSWLGSTWAFLCAGILVILWILTGPALHFSQAWQQTMQTATALATFLMVFLLQNATNRDARAINLKLNELIRAIDKARNHMIDIERLSDLELDELQATYERVKTIWSDRRRGNPGDSVASK
jgi:low affinity Fe/Cu permease